MRAQPPQSRTQQAQSLQSRTQQAQTLLAELTAIGAPTFSEQARSAFIYQWLRERIDAPMGRDELGNVWVDFAHGQSGARLFDAHIDTVFPFTEIAIRRNGNRWEAPGIFDNTVACALLMVWAWQRAQSGEPLPPLIISFSVGEEGEGNLCGIRALAQRFKPRLADAVAFDLNLEEASTLAVGSQRYRLHWRGGGGHSWNDFGAYSATHAAADWISRLHTAFPWQKGVFSYNVGTLGGGSGINVIADSAEARLDVRSTEPQRLHAFNDWLQAQAQRDDAHFDCQLIGARPAGALDPAHPLIATLKQAHAALGLPLRFAAYSTNANALLDAGIPTLMTGLARGGGIHSEKEFLEIDSIPAGLAKLDALAPDAAPAT